MSAERAVGARSGYDVEAVRRDFPILETTVHGRPLVYLDNAASAQKPRAVIEAEKTLYERYYSNIHRGVHQLSVLSTDAYEKARTTAQRFLNARESREILFVRSTTEAINLVAQTWGRKNVGAGDEVLISALEHHSNIVPWQMLCEEKGALLKVAPIDDDGAIDLEAYERLLSPRTKIVSLAHVSNALGTINPIQEMTGPRPRPGCGGDDRRGAGSPPRAPGRGGPRHATSTRSRGTRSTGPRGSACCTARPRSSRRCLPGRAGAT